MKLTSLRTTLRRFTLGLLVLAAAIEPVAAHPEADDGNTQAVRRAFDAWAAGTGGPYELLRDDVRWTIVGRSAAAGTYEDREAFLRDVIRPFNARMQSPLRPVVRGLHRDGDLVIVYFDARGIATDGVAYENTYTWYLTMEDGQIAKAVAFFDSIAFDELWTRVVPAADPAP